VLLEGGSKGEDIVMRRGGGTKTDRFLERGVRGEGRIGGKTEYERYHLIILDRYFAGYWEGCNKEGPRFS